MMQEIANPAHRLIPRGEEANSGAQSPGVYETASSTKALQSSIFRRFSAGHLSAVNG
jgi:hypothetical protein